VDNKDQSLPIFPEWIQGEQALTGTKYRFRISHKNRLFRERLTKPRRSALNPQALRCDPFFKTLFSEVKASGKVAGK
jgi:hypothetical protein